MSVIVTLWAKGDPRKLEQHASENRDAMRSIIQSAEEHGVIAHRFYGNEGQIMVIDEWPDAQSFQTFFEQTRDRIGPLMQAAGIQDEPSISVWEKLDTGDDYGWGA